MSQRYGESLLKDRLLLWDRQLTHERVDGKRYGFLGVKRLVQESI